MTPENYFKCVLFNFSIILSIYFLYGMPDTYNDRVTVILYSLFAIIAGPLGAALTCFIGICMLLAKLVEFLANNL